jgi:transposase
LSDEQRAELDAHVQSQLHASAASVAHCVAETFGVDYTVSGMTAVLRRLVYTNRKPNALRTLLTENFEIIRNSNRKAVSSK